ncbi:Ppx/GppA phosphatase family protein [Streptomonospora nanhaiensis]|uniref:Exopolyphosphatase/guanosine-5'-triphosphate, 3'-diphosphate pyrophosphatase n=1 Tax=Streptomonospora nanhaiensis TaxID=1323731 RepID=A0A853BKV7_9ACTN|nr:Ppx/GppA phosphatase family protein [Streptomonospora nanhaiensis]MBV2362046.1 Ppx/GppA family phosphatase [Streptomonospora nanhaiensis]NYI96128.1 exopolyphosphatase/guanosine-5'-triphosphate,3'-diphosphate pyrophosphatase [Streptomonospora nanhaiensis]
MSPQQHDDRPQGADDGHTATVGAIDCGTNSIRLLVAGVVGLSDDEVRLVDIDRRMEVVRLGQGVDRTGEFAPEALERTFAALREYAKLMRDSGIEPGPESVRMVATSATRDAANRAEFVAGVREIIGVEPEVISGEEEAELSFIGATAELEAGDGAAGTGFTPPFLVVDIGGGSTEFVLGWADPENPPQDAGAVRVSRSVDIGCVRLTERHLTDDPPTAEQIAAATADIDAALDAAAEAVPLAEAGTLVCVAGTATTVAGIALDLPEYDPERIHRAWVPAEDAHRIARELLAMPHERRSEIGVMHPGRVDVIGAGALILSRVVARTGAAGFVASEQDILDGIAWGLSLGGEE